MSSGRLRRLKRGATRSGSPTNNDSESGEQNDSKRGQALKLLRKKSYITKNKKLNSPVNSESAANWRARLRAARGFNTEENAETESSNARKVLLRINTAKYLGQDNIDIDKNTTNSPNNYSSSGNIAEQNVDFDKKEIDDEKNIERSSTPVAEKKNKQNNLARVSIFDKAKEKLKQNPHIAKTSTGKLLLRPSVTSHEKAPFRVK